MAASHRKALKHDERSLYAQDSSVPQCSAIPSNIFKSRVRAYGNTEPDTPIHAGGPIFVRTTDDLGYTCKTMLASQTTFISNALSRVQIIYTSLMLTIDPAGRLSVSIWTIQGVTKRKETVTPRRSGKRSWKALWSEKEGLGQPAALNMVGSGVAKSLPE
ncbi:hypothetical protein FRB97_008675 [Tulasnella sp. 331]|nr:hypothetical protein FRB97_008675 [Tulasnella sp. 331]